eukprot:764299-Pelagomonas_calceolata.AAC.5
MSFGELWRCAIKVDVPLVTPVSGMICMRGEESYQRKTFCRQEEAVTCLGTLARPPHAHGTAPNGRSSPSILPLVQMLRPGPGDGTDNKIQFPPANGCYSCSPVAS